MPLRPLVFLPGLTLGDYLLWHWSLSANHEVLALISGLSLPPLVVACVWLLTLTAGRLIARGTTLQRRRGAPATDGLEAGRGSLAGPPQPGEHGRAVATPGDDRGRMAA